MRSTPQLNHEAPLIGQLGKHIPHATRLDLAVAFARTPGVNLLLQLGIAPKTRAVIGLGFALTEPRAVEALADARARVRVITDEPEAFHPKLYIVTKRSQIVVFSGSGNLTGGGLETNIEQYEELVVAPSTSAAAKRHQGRFEKLWEMGTPFERASRYWKLYADRYESIDRQRRKLEGKAVGLTTSVGREARRGRNAGPRYSPQGWLLTVEQEQKPVPRGEDWELWTEPPWDHSTGDFRRRKDGEPFTPLWRPDDVIVMYHPGSGRCIALLDIESDAEWQENQGRFWTDTRVRAWNERTGPTLADIGVIKALQGGRHRLTEQQLHRAERAFKVRRAA